MASANCATDPVTPLHPCLQGTGEVRAQGVTAIVSEYAPGGDLFDYLFAPVHTGRPRPFAFPEALARHVGRQLIDGVLFLHGHEIYHRDLKVRFPTAGPGLRVCGVLYMLTQWGNWRCTA